MFSCWNNKYIWVYLVQVDKEQIFEIKFNYIFERHSINTNVYKN